MAFTFIPHMQGEEAFIAILRIEIQARGIGRQCITGD
ncbi:Uncharacterised protein [Vibrio cholerae]|nr:Uncharacterised protein [Vibrio cholerae]